MGEAKDRKEAAARTASDQVDNVVNLTYMSALYGARIIGATPQEVPRLCISAGHRAVERLLEQYHGIKEQEAETRVQLASLAEPQQTVELGRYEAMLDLRKVQILEAIQDLGLALSEGATALAALAETLRPSKALQ